jgi:hypothetical protein
MRKHFSLVVVAILCLLSANPLAAQGLININFAAYASDVKTGFAATGQTTNDYWNPYLAPFSNAAAVPNLKYANNVTSGAGLTVLNGPGHYNNSLFDIMYATYDYNQGGVITVTVTNLVAATYDIYVYGHAAADNANGIYALSAGGKSYGTNSTVFGPGWNSSVWQEGVQYVVFRNVAISNSLQTVNLSVYPSASSYAVISGMQIVPTGSAGTQAPFISSQPQNQSVTAGNNATFTVTASGTAPLGYQWLFNGTDLAGATNPSLTLTGVTTNQAGGYSVIITNSAGSVLSSNASLTVLPASTSSGLININFAAYADNVKTGFAATGVATNDYWNPYLAPFANAAAVTNLLYADSTASAAGLTVLNGPGHYNDNIPDQMYSTYDYNQGSPITITVTNLPATNYDIYVYGHAAADNANGIYALALGNVGYGTLATVAGPGWNSVVWQEGIQYVVFRGVNVTNPSQVLTLTVSPSASGYSIISGMQIVPAGASALQPPAIITQPQDQTVNTGNSTAFSVVVSGSAPLSYQWLFNGVSLVGATNPSLGLSSITTNQAGSYSVVITNAAGSATSASATLTVNEAPAITSQPQDQFVNAGDTASFSVTATGTAPLSYQWQFNGNVLAGATTSSLTVTGVGNANAGQYRVVVANVAGSLNSSFATLTVNAAPAITAQPQNQTVIEAVTATFNVGVSGTAPLSYQWLFNGATLAGATNPSLVLGSVTTNQAGLYSVLVTNVAGSVLSSTASLTVQSVNTSAGLININFAAYAENVKTGFAAAGESTNDYWNPYLAPFANAAAVTNLLYADSTISAAGLTVLNGPGHYNDSLPDQMYSTYDYNQGGSITVTVTNLAATNYDIYVYGHAAADNANGIYNLSVDTGSYGTLATVAGPGWDSVVWQEGVQYVVFRGVTITNSSQVLNLTVSPSASSYALISGMQIVPAAPLPPQPPAIVTQPQDQTVSAGNGVTFTVVASGSNPLGYQWQFNGTNISGATGNLYQISNVQSTNAGDYSVVVDNIYGNVTSSNATLVVNLLPYITSQPHSQSVPAGNNVLFTVSAGGATPFSYQWRFNGSDISGATASSYQILGAQSSNAGLYSALVTNPYGSVASSNATLTISAPPAITNQPQSQTIAAGGTAIFSVGANGTAPLHYQWRFNGSTLIGATNASLTITNVQSSRAGSYRVTVSNPVGSTTSANATLTVLGPPVITSQPQSQSVATGGTAAFSVGISGTNAVSYQWRFNGVAITGATASSYVINGVTAGQAGAYSVIVSNSVGSTTSSNATLSLVTVNTSPGLININFAAYADNVKTGFAAAGESTNDYWNPYLAPFANAAAVPYLKYADNTTSAAGLTVLNGYGHYNDGIPDQMYSTYDYNQGGPITITVTNLPATNYDIYVYGHAAADNANGVYALSAGGINYGTNATVFGPGWNSIAWQEGIQYVVFRGVTIADATQALNFTVYPSASGYALISGMQIVPAGAGAPQPPAIVTQPQSHTVPSGAGVTFNVTASGSAPLSFQWQFNGADLVGATGATLALSSVTTNQAGTYSVVVTNLAGSVTSSNAALTVIPPSVAGSPLININFAAYASDVKTGFAATGQAANDYWNPYLAPFANAAALPGLKYSDNTLSAAGLTVINGPGHYNDSLFDIMYATYDYAQGRNISVTVTNLAPATYDVYIYGHGPADNANGIYDLSVGATSYGTNSTVFGPGWKSSVWQEGVQYVVFRGVAITAPAQTLAVTVSPSASSYSIISGMQIVPAGALTPQPPAIVTQPQAQTVTAGSSLSFAVTASGAGPLSYQWHFDGADLVDATNATLALNSVATNQAGLYSVTITNSLGSVTSSNASLTVNTISDALINVNFAAYADNVKTGFAAAGRATNDYWNPYLAPFAAAAAVPNLVLSDGTVSASGLTVLNGYGHYNDSLPDQMYSTYDYNQGNPITITLTNLASATYDVYLYGHGPADNANGIYALSVDGLHYGTNSTVSGPGWNSVSWSEGVQYVVFRGVVIANASQVLTITVYPSASTYALISGLQLVPQNQAPPVTTTLVHSSYVNQTRQLKLNAGPSLSLSLGAGNLVLSWPASGTNYIVQESSTLTLSNAWSDLSTNAIVHGDASNSLAVPVPAGQKFYRLKLP